MIYLENVLIENFKCMEHFQLELEPGINLVIGDNGSGKTSVLEALATAIAGLVYHLDSPGAHNILSGDIRMQLLPKGSIGFTRRYFTPASISAEGVIGDRRCSWVRSRNSELPRSTTGMKGAGIREWSQDLLSDPEALWPIFAYRSAKALKLPEKKNVSLQMKPVERSQGYANALKAEITNVYDWIVRMKLAQNMQQEVREYELFRRFIGQTMAMMNEADQPADIDFDMNTMEFVYTEKGRTLPISQLSAGYYWILWLLIDLSVRSLTLNPQITALSEMEGIVLIDEIDLHLHPKWQWNILSTLQKAFPKVQFILTTHAPIVISSCKDANIIRIKDQIEPDYPGSAYAYSVQDVIEFTQGSDGLLPELKELYHSFEKAFNAKDYAQAEKVSCKLAEDFANSSETRKAQMKMSFIRR